MQITQYKCIKFRIRWVKLLIIKKASLDKKQKSNNNNNILWVFPIIAPP